MRKLAGAGAPFRSLMRKEDGGSFLGTIMPASDAPGASADYSAPRLVLRTSAAANVHLRDVVFTVGGPKYFVAEHYSADADWISWRLFQAEKQVAWTRAGAATDTLTGLPKAGVTPQALGTIWVASDIERRMFADRGLKIPVERQLLMTNKAVLEGDLLDGKQVVRANFELGMYILEAR
jgi:hypothetical protein